MNVFTRNPSALQDVQINVKVKLSALWTATMLCYAYGDIIGLFKPGILSDMIAGNMGPLGPTTQGLLLGVAVFMSIPALMVFLSLTLKPKVNRWLNIINGFLYTAVMVITIVMGAWSYYIYLGIVEMALTLLVMWIAWCWPRGEQHHGSYVANEV